MDADDRRERLRALPSVDRLATAVARAELADRRTDLLAGAEDDPDLVVRARSRLRPSLLRVLNATGVVVHTNLGRAPLAPAARDAVARAAHGYANLELDLGTGARGSRQDHVEALLRELTGAEAALAVNNCAAATLLAAAALAGGRELVVSRGQAIEIGGAFRIPAVVEQAGARLVEVGTTNRTRLADYAAVLRPETAAILRVHPSNFRTVGFVESVEIEALCGLGVPVIDDVGSGVLADDIAVLADEPPVRRSVRAGAAVVCFSGDKLLGGPQAGLLVGAPSAVEACRRHPLARAVRIDKLSLAALEATLALYRDPEHARAAIPVLAMLTVDEGVLAARAERLAAATGGTVIRAVARVGGGALPLLELHGPAVALDPGPAGVDRAGRRAAHGRSTGGRAHPGGQAAARPAHAGRRRGRRRRPRGPGGAGVLAAVEPLAHGELALGVLARAQLVAQLREPAEALGHDVVLVDRLEVLLPRRDERVGMQVGHPVDDAADHLAHAVLDEARPAVRLLDHDALVGPLHQLVDLRRHRVLDDREQPLAVDVDVAVLAAADVQRSQPALIVGRDGHRLEDPLDLVLAEAVREEPLARARLHERLRARACGHALRGHPDEPAGALARWPRRCRAGCRSPA